MRSLWDIIEKTCLSRLVDGISTRGEQPEAHGRKRISGSDFTHEQSTRKHTSYPNRCPPETHLETRYTTAARVTMTRDPEELSPRIASFKLGVERGPRLA